MSARSVLALAIITTSLATSGCRLVVELIETNANDDGAPDAGDDFDCARWTHAPETFDPCAVPRPNTSLELGDGVWSYDTTTGTLTDPTGNATNPTSALINAQGGIEARALSVAHFSISSGGTLRVQGEQPLILVSWTTADVDGLIDATSRAGAPAAGTNPDACTSTAAGTGEDNGEGAGGGGGGGFGTNGAAGGSGDDGGATAGRAGVAASIALRGGCRGGDGGNALHGVGGDGGGALVIAARETLTVKGTITAGGAGGGAAQGGRAGGGGGGSGGYVGLAGAQVALAPTAIVAANGGGGGGGSDGTPAVAGQDGQASTVAASAGAGQGMGSSGGAGGVRGSAPRPGVASHRGGGGGGGSVGVVRIDSPQQAIDASAVVSPAP